eukprot:Platyproteum_vivax@DN4247_c0_g1_i1.p1
MATKRLKRCLGAGLTCATVGSAVYYGFLKSFCDRHAYVLDGIALLKDETIVTEMLGSPVRSSFFKSGSLDKFAGQGTATVRVTGPRGSAKVHMLASYSLPKVDPIDLSEEQVEENFLQHQKRNFNYYWENPWMVKQDTIKYVGEGGYRIYCLLTNTKMPEDVKDWTLMGCFIEKNREFYVVRGNPYAHPAIQRAFIRDESKSKGRRSIRNLTILTTCVVVMGSLFLVSRSFRNMEKAMAQKFINLVIANNIAIKELLGEEIRILKISGKQKSRFVNIQMMVTGTLGAGRLSMSASRKSIRDPWFVSHLETLKGGVRYPIKLDKQLVYV